MPIDFNEIKEYLKEYDGPAMTLMEVCGSHTAAIAKYGIKAMLSDKIRLVSGPGCPVCVTPTAYVDRLIELALKENTRVVTFGDMIRVPGSSRSLGEARGDGAKVSMVYSPADTLKLAAKDPDTTFVFAAVGFETTTPAYALMLERMEKENIKNVQLLTALKTMPAVIDCLLGGGADIDGFIAPGHVSVITGSSAFIPAAEKYGLPFCVSGFRGEEILAAIYGLVKSRGQGRVLNFYPSAVTSEGSAEARNIVGRYFRPAAAAWRGLGEVPGSGLLLKDEYSEWDAGSAGLTEDVKKNSLCRCGEILSGKADPSDCPLFGKTCTPGKPMGACMVSQEGSCYHSYLNRVSDSEDSGDKR